MPPSDTLPGYKSLEGVKLVKREEDSVTLEFSVPASSPYYDGHFPDLPILPALAQVEMSVRFAAEHLGTGIDVQEIKRIKFSNLVIPGEPYHIKLTKNDKTLSFKVYSPGSEALYSSGTMMLRNQN